MNPHFAILRYYVSCPFVDDESAVKYEQYYGRGAYRRRHLIPDPRNRILTPAEAKRLIRQHGMVKVVDNEHGQVWEIELKKK